MNVCVIGAGWYGCHAARILIRHGVRVTLMDQSGIFHGASSKNQNRLHLGYHYPRSPETIRECQLGYARFLDEYGDVAISFRRNYYFVHMDSKTTIDDYRARFLGGYEETSLVEIGMKAHSLQNTVLVVPEQVIDTHKIQDAMMRELSDYLVLCSSPTIEPTNTCVRVNGVEYDYVLNCTNNQYNPISVLPPAVYETFCTFLYQLPTDSPIGFTVMDGPFFSIYPYDIENQIYTVTHVVYGVLSKTSSDTVRTVQEARLNTEREVFAVFPDLKLTYVGYFVSKKTKYDFIQDDRSIRWGRQGRYMSFSGGKITGMFEMELVVKETILCL